MVCDFYKDVKDSAGDEKKIVQRKNRKKDGGLFTWERLEKTCSTWVLAEATLYH
jgi:hypothetical protein